MRKILTALGALLLAGGSALAQQTYVVESYDAAPAEMQTLHIHRYAFDAMGRSASDTAADWCAGRPSGTMRTHRTAGDVAAAFFTLGWYTPEHVDVQCSTATSLR